MREQLQCLPRLGTGIQLTLVAGEPEWTACKQLVARSEDWKPNVKIVPPLVLGFTARRTACSADAKTFAGFGCIAVSEGAELEGFP